MDTLAPPHLALPLDRRPAYPDILAVGVPRGVKARLRDLAESRNTSVAALVRDALAPVLAPQGARP